MSRNTERRPSFWQEMKRRGVPKVMAMYAATAFIIMEAGDIMLPRLGLPEWTVTLVIILLIVGLPVAFILSWIFDITPHGVVKTEALKAGEDPEEEHSSGRRRLRISDGIIALLLLVVMVLVYPKIFMQGRSQIPRDIRGKISIAVMPFKNITGDSTYMLWQEGMQNLMITSLSNSPELAVRQFETMSSAFAGQKNLNYASLTPSMISQLAQQLEANTVIAGNLHKSGSKIRITANIMNAETEEVYKSYEMDGNTEDDFFTLADSLALQIRNFLEIKNMKQGVLFDAGEIFTQSASAYKLYVQGLNCHTRLDYICAAANYNKAIALDSSFVSAMLKLAYCYADMRQGVLSKSWAYKAYERMDHLPPDMQLLVKAVKAVVDKRPLEQLDYCKQYLELFPHSIYMHYVIGWTNFNVENWPEAIASFEKSLALLKKLDQHPWSWTYVLLGRAYHFEGLHKKEEKTFETGREHWPEQKSTFDYWQAICAVSRGDSVKVNYYMEEIGKMCDAMGWPEANKLLWYAGIYNWTESYDKAEEYYKQALSLRPGNEEIIYDLAHCLIDHELDLEEGIGLIVPLLEKHPENPFYLYTYGLGLYKTGQLVEADSVLQNSWDLRPYYDHKHFMAGNQVDYLLNRANS